jgi:hypothetical protein
MTENVENILLEHMRAIRAQLERMERDLTDVKVRIGSWERHQLAAHHDSIGQSGRIDNLDERLIRLEKRMELRDAP